MKHYHVEVFDDKGRDLLPPRVLVTIEAEEGADLQTLAKEEVDKHELVHSKVSYYVITEFENV